MKSMDRIKQRYEAQVLWLKNNYPNICEEQKHLDEASMERGYWHYGYAVALKDAMNLVSEL